MTYLAHSENDDGAGPVESLKEHLQCVANRAASYSQEFDAKDQAYAAGLLHDLGKYSDQFLRRLKSPATEHGRDHWSMGALLAASAYGKNKFGAAMAAVIAGHHVGLAELLTEEDCIRAIQKRFGSERNEFTETDTKLVAERFQADGFSLPAVARGFTPSHEFHAADMLNVRMLFSALVDADFIETEAHFEGDRTTPRRYRGEGPMLDIDGAIKALNCQIGIVRSDAVPSPMDDLRQQLFEECVGVGSISAMGAFTLAAPTGAGKTLAMLAFALHHARKHNLRRIVLVMPFLNIIEQTARIYRSIFSSDAGFAANTVLEHHSLADERRRRQDVGETKVIDDGVEDRRRMLAENWDAPIALTTSVQCLESLMANRPGACRKLHRLGRSVILFDEVQTLPPSLAVSTLATLSRLADPAGPFHSSVLFATATQPAFDVLHDRVRQFASAGWQPREIVGNPSPMYEAAAKRVRVSWRHDLPIELESLARELRGKKKVLCIVNLKRHAETLAKRLEEYGAKGVRHLSTNMCPAHRLAVLDDVRRRLKSERPRSVRLIATQCIEAGVDVDFPMVYRALAPLEAIAQAAGRCNRHGLRDTESVIVFKPIDEKGLYPPGYQEAVDATETFLANVRKASGNLDDVEILNSPSRLRTYFRQFYGLTGRDRLERGQDLPDETTLHDAIRRYDFEDVAANYQLIKTDTVNVLVPYDQLAFDGLVAEITKSGSRKPGFVRDWLRRAAQHAVGLFRPKDDDPIWTHLEPVPLSRKATTSFAETNWFIARGSLTYDPLTGLVAPESAACWIA